MTIDSIVLNAGKIQIKASDLESDQRLILGIRFKGDEGNNYALLVDLEEKGFEWEGDLLALTKYYYWNATTLIDILCMGDLDAKPMHLELEEGVKLESEEPIGIPNASLYVSLVKNTACLQIKWESELNPFAMQQQRNDSVPPAFMVFNMPKGGKLYFAKRENKSKDFLYDAFVEANVDEGYLDLTSQDVYGHFENADEIWDLVYGIEGLFYPVAIKEIHADYRPVSESILAKPFVSEGFFSLFTKNNVHKDKKKIRVAVMGTCYGRQVFNSDPYFNKDYKRRFECCLTSFHQSFCSMVAPKTDYDPKDVGEPRYARLVELYGEDEFRKTFLDKLVKADPDYVLVDMYIEAHACLLCKENGETITDAFYLEKTKPFEEFAYDRKIRPNSLLHVERFESACKKIRQSLLGKVDFHKFVLVKGKSAERYLDKNGKDVPFPNEPWIFNFDRYMFRYQTIFLSVFPEARVIDMREGKYRGNENSPLTLSRNHFESRYYRDFLDKFEKLVLEDMLAK